MRIAVLMETSGIVREAFRKKGHDTVSCDLLPSDDNPLYHSIMDAIDFLEGHSNGYFDLIIAHPTCKKLCVSGNHVYADGKPKHQGRIDAVTFTEDLWSMCVAKSKKVCFENPVGVLTTMSSCFPKPQYIQPYQFGQDASKKTGLFLHGLPNLKPTEHIDGKLFCCGVEIDEGLGKYGCPNCCGDHIAKRRWANQTPSGQNKLGPSKDRWKLRSRTYQGIADAMADQWG